jgi:hypothetical protein
MKLKALFLLLALAITVPVFATGTCTVTDVTSTQNANSRVPDSWTVDVVIKCTADGSGSIPTATAIPMSGSTSSSGLINTYNLFGYYLYQVGRTPGNVTASNTSCSATCPTANYSTTITDVQGFALDLGLLTSNGSATAAQMNVIANSTTNYPVVRSGNLVLGVTGNTSSNANAVIIFDLIFKSQ